MKLTIKRYMQKNVQSSETILEEKAIDKIARQRMEEIRRNPSIAKSEADLIAYLKKRGVDIVHMDN